MHLLQLLILWVCVIINFTKVVHIYNNESFCPNAKDLAQAKSFILIGF